MRAPRTIRARLTLAAAGTILAAVVLFAGATVVIVDHELHASLDSALRQRATEVAQLAVSTPAVLDDPGALESPVSGRQISVEVLDTHGRLLARSPSLGAQVLPEGGVARAALRHGADGSERVTIGGRPFELYAAPIADAGGPAAGGAVLVASDTTDIAQTTGRLGVLVALVGVIVVVVATLVAALLTRRDLLGLGRLASGAGEIERTGDPARRLPEPAREDEVGQLTGVLNRMLTSLEQSRTAERRFLADASHELRTPVTALLGNVDYAARHGADPEVLEDLRHDAARLARLVDSLLALERAGQAGAGTAPVRVDELVRAAIAAGDDDRVVAGGLQPATVPGDPEALRRAIGNLIDNGLVHGPAGGRVTVTVTGPGEVDGDPVRVSVSDAGPGPDAATRAHLFERFWRGPGTSDRPGAGLGLSIVIAIAEAHGGGVEVDGSTFTLVLPGSGPPGATAA
jgi:two-component system, OmpR family, sensor kinase